MASVRSASMPVIGMRLVGGGASVKCVAVCRSVRTVLRKMRRLRSIGTNIAPWLSSISALPRNSTPGSASAKWNRWRIRAWVSALKYMSVLRHTSRSMREIGASCTRSLRPKITERRRSLRKTNRSADRSKYRSSSSGGTPWTSRSV